MMSSGRNHEGGINQDILTSLGAELTRGPVARSCTLHGLGRIPNGAYGNAPDVMNTQSLTEIASWYYRTYISEDSNLLPKVDACICVLREKVRTNSRVSTVENYKLVATTDSGAQTHAQAILIAKRWAKGSILEDICSTILLWKRMP